jgi:general secretion pathway protein D
VFTLLHVEVTKLLPDLLKIFGTEGESPLAGMFRFMPIEQTNAIVVITPQPEYLKQAEDWLNRLDRGGAENAVQLYVYNVKNLKSPDLADYLSQIFLGTSGTSHRSSTSGQVGQGLRPMTMGGIGGSGGSMNYGSSMNNQNSSLRPQSNLEKSTTATTGGANANGANGKKESDIRISAIEENNQLMIMAQPYEWDQIQSAIRRLDIQPLQVQIEARILEVSLTGSLSMGVQWYLAGLIGSSTGSVGNGTVYGPGFAGNRQDRHRASLGAVAAGAAPTASGGLFYSFLNKNFEAVVSALESSTNTKTLSAPSMVVANNQQAQINVGQQIPVVQTSLIGVGGLTGTNTSATGYSSVQYLNTGVQLSVTPRVNPGGLVYLDVQQEVSSPGPPATDGANPPINQRQIQTQVAVQSGETVLLGGLISENTGDTTNGIPGISRIPILKNIFGNTKNSRDRTELIVLITPRVINNSDDAREMTLDYSRQFESLAPLRVQQQAAIPATPAVVPTAPSSPASTYPVPEPVKPQEEQLRDH